MTGQAAVHSPTAKQLTSHQAHSDGSEFNSSRYVCLSEGCPESGSRFTRGFLPNSGDSEVRRESSGFLREAQLGECDVNPLSQQRQRFDIATKPCPDNAGRPGRREPPECLDGKPHWRGSCTDIAEALLKLFDPGSRHMAEEFQCQMNTLGCYPLNVRPCNSLSQILYDCMEVSLDVVWQLDGNKGA